MRRKFPGYKLKVIASILGNFPCTWEKGREASENGKFRGLETITFSNVSSQEIFDAKFVDHSIFCFHNLMWDICAQI